MTAVTLFSAVAAPPPPTPFAHIRGLVIAGSAIAGIFVLVAGIWAAWAPLESAAMATGLVESASNRKTVQHLEGGIIAEILVHDADVVAAGQPLLRLQNTTTRT